MKPTEQFDNCHTLAKKTSRFFYKDHKTKQFFFILVLYVYISSLNIPLNIQAMLCWCRLVFEFDYKLVVAIHYAKQMRKTTVDFIAFLPA